MTVINRELALKFAFQRSCRFDLDLYFIQDLYIYRDNERNHSSTRLLTWVEDVLFSSLLE